MTPKERAKEATWEAGCPDWNTDDRERLEMAVEQAIIAAVEECAKIAESEVLTVPQAVKTHYAEGYKSAAAYIAEQIRARK